MEYIFEYIFRLQAWNYAQNCTPSCMIFEEISGFLKNRYSEKPPWWRDAFALICLKELHKNNEAQIGE